MTEPIKLPPLPEGYTLTKPWGYEGQVFTEGQMKAYARAAIEADRQSRNCGQCVPLSTDGKSVFIDGVGEVPLDFGGQANNLEPLTPAEAVFAFASWLTGRSDPVTLSSRHGAAIAVDLAVAFNESQGLHRFREYFHKHIKPYPAEKDQQARSEQVARVNSDGFIVETGLGLAPGTLLYTAPQPQQAPVKDISEGYKPTKLNIGVSATAEGAAICIMKPNADGTVTVIYSGTHPLGDSLGCAMLEAAQKE